MVTVSLTVKLQAPFGTRVYICGSSPGIGSWNAAEAAEMTWAEGDLWSCVVSLPAGATVEYKVLQLRDGAFQWPAGDNSKLETRLARPGAQPSRVLTSGHTHTVKDIVEAAAGGSAAQGGAPRAAVAPRAAAAPAAPPPVAQQPAPAQVPAPAAAAAAAPAPAPAAPANGHSEEVTRTVGELAAAAASRGKSTGTAAATTRTVKTETVEVTTELKFLSDDPAGAAAGVAQAFVEPETPEVIQPPRAQQQHAPSGGGVLNAEFVDLDGGRPAADPDGASAPPSSSSSAAAAAGGAGMLHGHSEIAAWLASMGLERYVPAFHEHDIFHVDDLRYLTEHDLRYELGLKLLPARKILSHLPQQLQLLQLPPLEPRQFAQLPPGPAAGPPAYRAGQLPGQAAYGAAPAAEPPGYAQQQPPPYLPGGPVEQQNMYRSPVPPQQ